MNRRAARWLVPILAVLAVIGGASNPAKAALPSVVTAAAASGIDPDRPVATANEFFPDERNLSECVGVLERPGCGSEERGGWAQTAVFVVMLAAMALIFGRIAYGVRKNRAGLDGT